MEAANQPTSAFTPTDYRGVFTGAKLANLDCMQLASILTILVICVQAPAFLYEDSLFFSYVNNVDKPLPIYLYYGYFQAISETITYLLHPLPFLAQAILYRIVAAAFILAIFASA